MIGKTFAMTIRSAIFGIALALCFAAPAVADQSSICLPTTGTVSGLTLVTNMNSALKALLTTASGSSTPANDCTAVALEGQLWLDNSANPSIWKIFDGTAWQVVGIVDEADGVFKPPVGGGATSIASASTTDLWTKPETYITVSGTNTISALATSTAVIGTSKIIAFSGALTLTHNATSLILPTAANITTAAGDRAIVVSLGGGNVAIVSYQRANGQPVGSTSTLSANLILSGVISPTSLSTSQNDYAPTGIGTASVIRLTASTAVNITGFAAQTSGSVLTLQNISTTETITLVDASASSSAANRFSNGGDFLLGPQQAAIIRYDGTLSRWVIIASSRQVATQLQATTGTDNTVLMTPLRTLQSIQTGYRYIGSQILTTTGTYTPTSGARFAIAWGVGGGAGGGGADAADTDSGNGAGGGGAGQMFRCELSLVGVSSITYTIGAAGTAGTGAGGGSGGDGGDTILTGYATADGGHGGEGVTGDATRGADGGAGGNTGGSVSGCSNGLLISGAPGGFGTAYVYGAGFNEGGNGGHGGSTLFGGGGNGTNARGSSQSQAGVTATGYGAGGSGAAAADNTAGFAGGAGFKGIILIEEYN